MPFLTVFWAHNETFIVVLQIATVTQAVHSGVMLQIPHTSYISSDVYPHNKVLIYCYNPGS